MTRKSGPNQGPEWWREPERDAPITLSLPNISGHEYLVELVVDYGGVERAAKDMRVSVDLLQRYLSGAMEPPWSLLCALWWHSAHGFKQAFAEAHWSHQYNSFRRRQAEAQVGHLEQVLEQAVALLEHRADASAFVAQALDLARAGEQSPGTRSRVLDLRSETVPSPSDVEEQPNVAHRGRTSGGVVCRFSTAGEGHPPQVAGSHEGEGRSSALGPEGQPAGVPGAQRRVSNGRGRRLDVAFPKGDALSSK